MAIVDSDEDQIIKDDDHNQKDFNLHLDNFEFAEEDQFFNDLPPIVTDMKAIAD